MLCNEAAQDTTVREKILEFLETQHDWVFGGVIEDYVRAHLGNKASNASRVCRTLEKKTLLENRYVIVEHRNRKLRVVQYRLLRQANIQEPPSIIERKKIHTYPSKTKRGIYYNAVETEYGLICDCPSYQFRLLSNDGATTPFLPKDEF